MAVTIDGTTGISAVQAGAVESSDLPAGSVIQVKSYSAEISFSGTGDSALAVTITPSSTSSKIFIFATLAKTSGSGGDGSSAYFGFKRNSTDLGDFAHLYRDGTREGGHSLSYLDSPSSTSSLTYRVRGTTAVIENLANSTITVMEIAG